MSTDRFENEVKTGIATRELYKAYRAHATRERKQLVGYDAFASSWFRTTIIHRVHMQELYQTDPVAEVTGTGTTDGSFHK